MKPSGAWPEHASLADAQEGAGAESELEALQAQLKQAREALTLADNEFKRRDDLARSGAVAHEEIDRARSERDQAAQRVAQLSAELKTGRLGARSDQVAAAEANVHALEATLTRAQWDLAQKSQTAPKAGLVFRHTLS